MSDVTDEDLITEEEKQLLKEAIGDDYPMPEDKANIYSLFKKILALKDSSKVGNLAADELGLPMNPVRVYQDLSLYASTRGLEPISKYLKGMGEITLATSLSKDGFLDRIIVTQKKEITRPKQHREVKSGWFTKKTSEDQVEQ